MRIRVIAQDVAAGGDFLHEIGAFTGKFSHDEESGFGVVASEEIEELRRDVERVFAEYPPD